MSFEKKMKLFLEKEKVKQKDLASEINMNYTQVNNFINGNKKYSVKFLEKIMARFPDLDMNWLLRDSKPVKPAEPIEPVENFSDEPPLLYPRPDNLEDAARKSIEMLSYALSSK